MTNSERISQRALEWALWLAFLAAVTAGFVAIRSQLHGVHVLAYLLIVQLGSARRGRNLGVTLAILSFLCIDWFLTPPYGTLSVGKQIDWLTLIAFLATAFVATQLFERARAEAREARSRAAEVHRLAYLRETARVKDALLASVSHDLRTPLTTIKALAHEISAAGDDRAGMIEEEADRLSSFVRDLLDLSRFTGGGTTLNLEANEAEDLVGAALQAVSGAAQGRDIRVSFEPGDSLLFGRFDFAQTLRELVNLIENALKYSPVSEPVDVVVKREGANLAISVADRGAGVPPAESERIFEPFYRPAGSPPDAGGAGLGLSIARAIAESQSGSLKYRSREGGGSVFTIHVPAVEIAEPIKAPIFTESSR
jgi:two-component system sensor histidine kinase KdpD